MKKLNQDLNFLLMKKLILMNNSRLIFTYSFFFLLINILVGLNSLDFYSGEQYGYWYFNKIFGIESLFPDVSRSPIYIIYLNLFSWIDVPFNYYSEAIISNFLLSISLFFLFRKEYNSFYVFLIIALSIGFFYNLIPYPQALALSFLNFAIILRRTKNSLNYFLSYTLIILAIYCRITYIIVLILFIFFDLFKEYQNFLKKNKSFDYKKIFLLFIIITIFFIANSFFKSRISPSKFNNGYFQSLEWKPSKSKSNIDIAFQVNFNFLYNEKYKENINKNEKDFYFVNKVAFHGSETLLESINSNPKFVIWGIIKNTSHLVPLILNKFNSRNYLPSCSGIGHSCYANYFYISFVFILFLLFNYYFFFKKKYENDLDIKCYSIINYALIISTVLAMPKLRYMTPFVFFLVPFNLYLISMLIKVVKFKKIQIILSILLIFSFSYFNYTYQYLKDYLSFEKILKNFDSIKNYHSKISQLNSKIRNCDTIFVNNPTFILANNNFFEHQVYSLHDIPPFGNYKDEQKLRIYKNINIECLLLDNEMKFAGGASRGNATDFEIRRKNYLEPFLISNERNLVELTDYGTFGKLYIYATK